MSKLKIVSLGFALINTFLLFVVIQFSYNWILSPSFSLPLINYRQAIALEIFTTPFLAYTETKTRIGKELEERVKINVGIFSYLITCFGMSLVWRLLIS